MNIREIKFNKHICTIWSPHLQRTHTDFFFKHKYFFEDIEYYFFDQKFVTFIDCPYDNKIIDMPKVQTST